MKSIQKIILFVGLLKLASCLPSEKDSSKAMTPADEKYFMPLFYTFDNPFVVEQATKDPNAKPNIDKERLKLLQQKGDKTQCGCLILKKLNNRSLEGGKSTNVSYCNAAYFGFSHFINMKIFKMFYLWAKEINSADDFCEQGLKSNKYKIKIENLRAKTIKSSIKLINKRQEFEITIEPQKNLGNAFYATSEKSSCDVNANFDVSEDDAKACLMKESSKFSENKGLEEQLFQGDDGKSFFDPDGWFGFIGKRPRINWAFEFFEKQMNLADSNNLGIKDNNSFDYNLSLFHYIIYNIAIRYAPVKEIILSAKSDALLKDIIELAEPDDLVKKIIKLIKPDSKQKTAIDEAIHAMINLLGYKKFDVMAILSLREQVKKGEYLVPCMTFKLKFQPKYIDNKPPEFVVPNTNLSLYLVIVAFPAQASNNLNSFQFEGYAVIQETFLKGSLETGTGKASDLDKPFVIRSADIIDESSYSYKDMEDSTKNNVKKILKEKGFVAFKLHDHGATAEPSNNEDGLICSQVAIFIRRAIMHVMQLQSTMKCEANLFCPKGIVNLIPHGSPREKIRKNKKTTKFGGDDDNQPEIEDMEFGGQNLKLIGEIQIEKVKLDGPITVQSGGGSSEPEVQLFDLDFDCSNFLALLEDEKKKTKFRLAALMNNWRNEKDAFFGLEFECQRDDQRIYNSCYELNESRFVIKPFPYQNTKLGYLLDIRFWTESDKPANPSSSIPPEQNLLCFEISMSYKMQVRTSLDCVARPEGVKDSAQVSTLLVAYYSLVLNRVADNFSAFLNLHAQRFTASSVRRIFLGYFNSAPKSNAQKKADAQKEMLLHTEMDLTNLDNVFDLWFADWPEIKINVQITATQTGDFINLEMRLGTNTYNLQIPMFYLSEQETRINFFNPESAVEESSEIVANWLEALNIQAARFEGFDSSSIQGKDSANFKFEFDKIADEARKSYFEKNFREDILAWLRECLQADSVGLSDDLQFTAETFSETFFETANAYRVQQVSEKPEDKEKISTLDSNVSASFNIDQEIFAKMLKEASIQGFIKNKIYSFEIVLLFLRYMVSLCFKPEERFDFINYDENSAASILPSVRFNVKLIDDPFTGEPVKNSAQSVLGDALPLQLDNVEWWTTPPPNPKRITGIENFSDFIYKVSKARSKFKTNYAQLIFWLPGDIKRKLQLRVFEFISGPFTLVNLVFRGQFFSWDYVYSFESYEVFYAQVLNSLNEVLRHYQSIIAAGAGELVYEWNFHQVEIENIITKLSTTFEALSPYICRYEHPKKKQKVYRVDFVVLRKQLAIPESALDSQPKPAEFDTPKSFFENPKVGNQSPNKCEAYKHEHELFKLARINFIRKGSSKRFKPEVYRDETAESSEPSQPLRPETNPHMFIIKFFLPMNSNVSKAPGTMQKKELTFKSSYNYKFDSVISNLVDSTVTSMYDLSKVETTKA